MRILWQSRTGVHSARLSKSCYKTPRQESASSSEQTLHRVPWRAGSAARPRSQTAGGCSACWQHCPGIEMLAAIRKALPDFEAPLIDPDTSLREVMQMTTHQSLCTGPGDTLFLGSESLCGYSASLCQTQVVQNTDEEQRLPVRRSRNERSAAAYPIQRGGAVAGAFLVSNPQPDFFYQRLQSLLQLYAHLLGLAFETEAFYPPDRIRLRLMPAEQIQHPYIGGFQQQVISLLQDDPSPSRREAEVAAWHQIEEELLALPESHDQERRR